MLQLLLVRDTEGPLTCPTLIMGYSQEMYSGVYPTLVDGPPENIIHGKALKVTSPVRASGIAAAYLTYQYVNQECIKMGRLFQG